MSKKEKRKDNIGTIKEKGITLIALIITIIILIILASIGIRAVIGDHGLFQMTQEAAENMRIAEYREGLVEIGAVLAEKQIFDDLKGRAYLEEFKKKVEESEQFKGMRSAEIIEDTGEGEEKLRIVTKEGYVFDVTEEDVKNVGKVGEGEGFKPLPDIKEGSIIIELDKKEWTHEIPIHATITVNDVSEEDLSGLIVEYTKDPKAQTGWTNYTKGSKIDITANGVIIARVKNNIGETSKTATKKINIIDTVAPKDPTSVMATAEEGADGKRNCIKVTATAQDGDETPEKPEEQSGIAKIQVKIDGGNWLDVEASTNEGDTVTKEYTFSSQTDGIYTIQVKAIDKAGNESQPVSASPVTVDTIPPSAPIITVADTDGDNQNQSSYASAIQVTITPGQDTGDVATGVKETIYNILGPTGSLEPQGKIDGTDLIENVTLTNEGQYTITATSIDGAENKSKEAIIQVTKKLGIGDMVSASNYGEAVDYPIDLDGNGNYDDWKIFYKNEDGRVFIIADDYVPNTNKELQDAQSLAKLSPKSTYGNYWSDMRYIKCSYDDAMLKLFMATKYSLLSHSSYPNSECAAIFLENSYWRSFIDVGSTYGMYAVGEPTLEMWCASWNAALSSSSIFKKMEIFTSNFGYQFSSPSSSESDNPTFIPTGDNWPNEEQLDELKTSYSLYFPHVKSENLDIRKYFLASPSAFHDYYLNQYRMCAVSDSGVVTWSYYFGESEAFALRPVVCLRSNVSATHDTNLKSYKLSK